METRFRDVGNDLGIDILEALDIFLLRFDIGREVDAVLRFNAHCFGTGRI